MGIWAEIKHALNSTLGTSDFQPLDKLLMYGSKQFAPGSDIYTTLHSGTELTSSIPNNTITGSIVDISSICPKISGSFTVRANVGVYTSGSDTVYANLLVYINGVQYTKGTYSGKTDTSGIIESTVSFDAGDTISFKLQAGLSSSNNRVTRASCSRLSILAHIVDNLIEKL